MPDTAPYTPHSGDLTGAKGGAATKARLQQLGLQSKGVAAKGAAKGARPKSEKVGLRQ